MLARRHIVAVAAILAGLVGSGLAAQARAERAEPAPKELEGVGMTERLGVELPAGLTFTADDGRTVRLGDLLAGDTPTLLTFNYSNCPMLCSIQLDAFAKALGAMSWTPGVEYRVVTVVLDPTEPVTRAAETKQRYLKSFTRPEAAAGWHFLVGDEASVRTLADTVGFTYRYDAQRKEYLHVPAVMVVGVGRKLSRVLYGIEYAPATIRLSLVEASLGKVRETLDPLMLYCFQYDAAAGSYALQARKLMKLGGAVTVVGLTALFGAYWRHERRKTKTGVDDAPPRTRTREVTP